LLINIGKEHPQALVFPLNLALKSQSPQRIAAAQSVMENIRKHDPTLVEQALMVSHELVRVAILWFEMWHEGLEDASRFHFQENNPTQSIIRLKALHDMLDKGPETLSEVAFQQAAGRDLEEAIEWIQRYEKSRKMADLNQSWDCIIMSLRLPRLL
jgi:FKBP12-rapamycin complex-associated protein